MKHAARTMNAQGTAFKTLALFLIASLVWSAGCSTTMLDMKPERVHPPDIITAVVLIDSSMVEFPSNTGYYDRANGRFGSTHNPALSVRADSVAWVVVERTDIDFAKVGAAILVGGILALLIYWLWVTRVQGKYRQYWDSDGY